MNKILKMTESQIICQSCGMPLDRKEIFGTEKDGPRSEKFCKYCYEDGAFTRPEMTLDEMKERVKTYLMEIDMPEDFISQALKELPALERWVGRTMHFSI